MTTTASYKYTGAQQKFTVPDQVTSITATLIGGNGGGGSNGGKVSATFAVTPGQVLYLYVGGDGAVATASADATGGYNGGGKATRQASGVQPGGGGGATDIRIGGTALTNRVLVAAGAGGRGGAGYGATNTSSGGAGGKGGAATGQTGINGVDGVIDLGGGGGVGGTQSAGGVGGHNTVGQLDGLSGALGTGGGTSATFAAPAGGHGGGGGAGYYGGGGGEQGGYSSGSPTRATGGGGGGGGSNLISATINGVAPTATSTIQGDAGTPGITLVYTAKPTVTASLPNSVTGLSTASTTGVFTFTPKTDDNLATTAYQIVIERNSDGTSLLDTGKITSSSTAPVVTVSTLPADVDLRWKVRVWNTAGLVSDYTPYTIFQYGTPPAWTASPATGTWPNGSPVVSWADATVASSRNAASYSVSIRDASNSVVASTSGPDFSQVQSYTSPTPILANGQVYTVIVTLTDSGGISATKTSTITASYTQPTALSYTIDNDPTKTNGYIGIDWSAANPDSNWVKWHIWRKLDTDADWTLLYETTNPSDRLYADWLVSSGFNYRYSVTQVAIVSGQEIEGPIGWANTGQDVNVYAVQYDQYWVIDTTNGLFSTMIPNVTTADISDEFDSNTYQIIGRGRKVDYGDRLGYTGTLSAQLRGYSGEPELIRAKIEGMRLAQDTLFLRSPFGDLFQIALGQVTFTLLAGTGTSAMYDVSIPYSEISGDIVEEVSMPVNVTTTDNGDGTTTLTIYDVTAGISFTDDNLIVVSF